MLKDFYNYFIPRFDWIPSSKPSHPHPELAGKLLQRNEIHVPEEQLKYLIQQSVLTEVDAIERFVWGYRCRRCGNRKHDLFAKMPHANCGKECVYCRHCIQLGRVMDCEPLYYGSSSLQWPEYNCPCQWEGELSHHQEKAAAEIKKIIHHGKGELLVWAVCGAGKTEMLYPGLTLALEKGKRICLATPRVDVVRELYPRFQKAFHDVKIQALYGDSDEKRGDASFLVATTHQLYRYAHAFDVIIIDEVDAFPYHNDPTLHFASKRAAKPDASIIYLTATPRKKFKRRIKSGNLPSVFIPRRFHGHPLPVPTLKMMYNLPSYSKRNLLPPAILNTIRRQQSTNRQLLLFFPSIKKAEETARTLSTRGYQVKSVHSEDPDRERKILQFRNKEYRILVTTTILERGVTFPSVDVYVIDAGHEVFDEAALVQIAGRAGRSPEDPDGEVIFFHSGKTNALLDAVDHIRDMNRLADRS
ncbi:DEAD/DEAH box helicase [Halobacillus yeomjeoni]|uniref:DEAD/DEAH box helicase n=1 Tax=Halobacillus yeomjeoni TaxID=311194 RepID=A0A931HWU0_9BACI|nr:DEAD/DEAH box helicase [Halobacillus yeomjeoni]MBH0230874.1 DEAD/DEAH box helicase [Halobacillus yeomjeoni]